MDLAFLIFILVSRVHAIPTSKDFGKVVEGTKHDVEALISAKSSLVSATADATLESLKPVVSKVSSVDPIGILDSAESKILSSKTKTLNAVFDAKRAVVHGLQTAKRNKADAIVGLYNSTVRDISITDAKEAAAESFATTQAVITETASALIKALIEAKASLHRITSNFDSKKTFIASKRIVGSAISSGLTSGVKGAEVVKEQLGIYDALDNLIRGFADVVQGFNRSVKKIVIAKKASATDEIIDQFSQKVAGRRGVIDGTEILEEVEHDVEI